MARLIDVNRECDRLDDMYTLGEIGRRERDDMAVFMLEIAMPVEAIPVDMIKGRINDLKKMLMDTDDDDVDLIWHLRTEIETLRELLEMWRKENDTTD